MIEQKLLRGNIVDGLPHAGNNMHVGTAAFVVVNPPKNWSMLPSTAGIFGPKKRIVSHNTNANKNWRNFDFLDWLPGDISLTPLTTDVVTGPMSGCQLGTIMYNGVLHAYHVGTQDGKDTANAAVKQTFHNYCVAQGIQPTGFNPLRQWNGNYPAAKKGEGREYVYGIITTNGNFYALFTYGEANGQKNRIAGIQQIAPLAAQVAILGG